MSRKLASSLRRTIGKKDPQSRKPASYQPCVERLEDRLAPAAPTVTSPAAPSITPTAAVLGGNVTNDGGLLVVKRGVVFSLTSANPDPTVGGKGVTEIDAPQYANTGVFYVTAGPLTANSTYSFKAFAINPNGTGYTSAATFHTTSGILMPGSTVFPKNDQDWAELNKVLFFHAALGQKLPGSNTPVPPIPEKQLIITNNLTTTVYPFMRDAAATIDPRAKGQGIYQGFYDPIDQMNEEYRGYIGYSVNGANYLGLPPGMTITVNVPLVFWDGSRMEIGVDGTYLVNNATVDGSTLIPNPYQYYDQNPARDPSTGTTSTARVALPAVSTSGGPAGVTGMVMWYRQGLNNQTDRTNPAPEQAKATRNDAPSQLIEWTMRDPVLSIVNPNIDILKPNFGETHANINYDVSYVDSMALPVAMEALDVPVPVQPTPSLDPRNPNPGPRLPFGWIGAAQTADELQAELRDFTSNGAANHLGTYFDGKGWPRYDLPASAFTGGTPPIKVPSGQDAIYDTPLADKSSSYDILANLFMLTSGGTTFKQVVGGNGGTSDGTSTIQLVPDGTTDGSGKLETQLQVGMVVGGPSVVQGKGFFVGKILYMPDGKTVKGVEVEDANHKPVNVQAATGVFTFVRPRLDYATTRLISLWYAWAKYYVDNAGGTDYPSGLPGKSNTADPKAPDNVIILKDPATGLVPGMLVTGSAGSGMSTTSATTIESIDPDGKTIHLSQAVGVSTDPTNYGSTYFFARPTMTSPAIAGFDQAVPLPKPLNPSDNKPDGVTDVKKFAQFAYQMLSLMSQIPSTSDDEPISAQVMGNVIGGNITNAALNGDAFHHTEVAYRTKIKSLLRGVNDYNVQNDPTKWYPDPGAGAGGQSFNAYNLDPFVWFIHKQMGLSGYGFSLDDDTADVSGNFSTKLGVAIGGLNGLPNQFEWSLAAPFGPVSGTAKVVSNGQIDGLPPYDFFSVFPYNNNENIPGANIQGEGVPPKSNLLEVGSQGLYSYAYILTDLFPPANRPPLQIPPLVIGGTSQFTLLGNGTVNTGTGLITVDTEPVGPYVNSLHPVIIPSGVTLKITAPVGNLTSYTQQFEPMARVSIVPTSALNKDGTGPTTFVDNAPLPGLDTVVNGTLEAGRVAVVNGRLSGNGTVKGSISVFGPVSGYANPIVLKPVAGEKVDTSWDNPKNVIRGTNGGDLLAGAAAAGVGTPGHLTVTGDVTLYGATMTVFARGAAIPGHDYSRLASGGDVNLGNSKLELSLSGYTPKAGDSLTVITAAKGVTGEFSQGNSITVNGHMFKIIYNAKSVVLTYVPPPPPPPPPLVGRKLRRGREF
jgi:hypothetical protein